MNPAPPVIRIMAAGYRIPLRLAIGVLDGAKGNQVMAERPRFFDDLAGVAGGAISALAGLRQEAEAIVRARLRQATDDAIREVIEEFEVSKRLKQIKKSKAPRGGPHPSR